MKKQRTKPAMTIDLRNVGQIKEAHVEFGDLTVIVGPQATGKSIFLQWLKLAVDKPSVLAEFKKYGFDWKGDPGVFLDLYFGDGMQSMWSEASSISVDGSKLTLQAVMRQSPGSKTEKLFYIPAQRVMSFREGVSRPFTDYRAGDPFVLPEFSDRLHQLIQNEYGKRQSELFPQGKRLKAELRKKIGEHVFGGFQLRTDDEKYQKRIVLRNPKSKKALPYLVWSAGQREFVPLLMGLYWLMPPGAKTKHDTLNWVVMEEVEMGLHPDAITTVLLAVVELLSRGYKVCLSTHSPHVLDLVWALRYFQTHAGEEKDVLKLFKLPSTGPLKKMAGEALRKDYRVYFFKRDGHVKDISSLDPMDDDPEISGWGGLTGASSNVADVVGEVAGRFEAAKKK